MNPKRNTKPEPKCKDHTEPFSELRTIPTGWDMSEFSKVAHPVKEPDPSDSLVDPQTEPPAVDL
jgi:hypothetical protein